jgi:hypothetical protein
MTSLDDRLRDLYASSGPDAAELDGDLRQVRTRVRQRALRRRAAIGAVAAAIVAGGAFLLVNRDGGDEVRTDLPPVTEAEVSTTTAPAPSTTDPTAGASGTTVASTTTSTSSTTTTSSSTTTPPVPSIREVALGEATYANACPGFDDGRSATLQGGMANLPAGSGVTHEVSLGPVGYADIDGDGGDDAMLLLRCVFVGASTDSTAQLRAYRATGGGSIEQIGASQLIEHDFSATADGRRITVVVEKFEPGDAMCCPSSAASEVWRFDGSGFVLEDSTPTTTPNTPR